MVLYGNNFVWSFEFINHCYLMQLWKPTLTFKARRITHNKTYNATR